jgi:hypothetical protein
MPFSNLIENAKGKLKCPIPFFNFVGKGRNNLQYNFKNLDWSSFVLVSWGACGCGLDVNISNRSV